MIIKVAHFANIMLYALVAGVMWGTWLSLARTMTSYDKLTFLTDGRHMIANLATIMAILMITTAVAGLVLTIILFTRRRVGPAWLALIGLLLLGGVIAITLSVNVPIDNDIKRWTLDTMPANWADLRERWAQFHTIRTFLSLAGLAAVVGSGLAMSTSER